MPLDIGFARRCVFVSFAGAAFGQAECFGWGGLRGIRVDGELMAFTTGIRAVSPGSAVVQSGGEKLNDVQFFREGDKQTCSGGLRIGEPRPGGGFGFRAPSRLNCTIVFEDVGTGAVTIDIQAKANADVKLAGIYFLVHLPGSDYSNGSVQPIEATPPFNAPVSLAATRPSERNHYFAGSARGLDVVSRNRQLEMTFDAPRNIVIEDDRRKPDAGLDIYFPLTTGNMAAGQSVHANITFKASGDVDKTPASLTIDPSQRGRPFDGIGGNFRLQTPADPPQIQYNLENLRVAWGRVAMPLNLWQPDENEDPIQAATAGKLDAGVRDAMEMARRLRKRKFP